MTVTQAVVDSDDDGDGDNNSEVNHKCAGLLFSLYCLFFFFFWFFCAVKKTRWRAEFVFAKKI